MLNEGVEAMLADDIVEQAASSDNELYSYSRESGFREKIRIAAAEAVDELLRRDQKNFADPIDEQTKGWAAEIAQSGKDPDEEVKGYGRILIGSLSTLAGGKENLMKKVVALMIEDKKRQAEQDGEARQ
ncbi:MAG: hypothetical protein A3E38_01945 [Candidatus Moranbacteria bacterium RIFCSPHIGHO2_12_FULL_54_9]|nr:MAG: hypothetical protein A2878_00235 [Candidatus Moranbacteria bacterium RIFCSPHIGHO2_01_FULL_54_31]OGI24555.1 MAG: hypothetical protein A3E38_01945 [Candidatus Moranbacteria bacterium RIFCSPHIGHO2_12_FULL_54_9]